MEGLCLEIPRALVPEYLKGPIDYCYRGGFIIELHEYDNGWYAYAVDGGFPEDSFLAIRHGIYNRVEHEDLTELALELLKQ